MRLACVLDLPIGQLKLSSNLLVGIRSSRLRRVEFCLGSGSSGGSGVVGICIYINNME